MRRLLVAGVEDMEKIRKKAMGGKRLYEKKTLEPKFSERLRKRTCQSCLFIRRARGVRPFAFHLPSAAYVAQSRKALSKKKLAYEISQLGVHQLEPI